MKLDLSEILANVGMRYAYDVDEPPIVDEDLECTKRVRGKLTFANTGSVLLVDGEVKTHVAVPCSRCLVYFEEPAEAPISEQFALLVKPAGPHARQATIVVEEDENPDAGKMFDGHLFDLTELLRQNITLSLTSQPLHDENCKGLCPHCGKDLNEGPCECTPEITDPAMSKLGELLKELKN
jgi:uncharacterized protein